MKRKLALFGLLLIVSFIWITPVTHVSAAEPIVIGVPTSLGFLEGKEAHKAVQIAVSEINAKGGVNVGGTKRLLKVAAADLRDAAPGVPVPEALLGLEKKGAIAPGKDADLVLLDNDRSVHTTFVAGKIVFQK